MRAEFSSRPPGERPLSRNDGGSRSQAAPLPAPHPHPTPPVPTPLPSPHPTPALSSAREGIVVGAVSPKAGLPSSTEVSPRGPLGPPEPTPL